MVLTVIVICIGIFLAVSILLVARWVGAEVPPEQIKDEDGFAIDWDSLPKGPPRKMIAPDDDPEFLRRLGNRRPDDS